MCVLLTIGTSLDADAKKAKKRKPAQERPSSFTVSQDFNCNAYTERNPEYAGEISVIHYRGFRASDRRMLIVQRMDEDYAFAYTAYPVGGISDTYVIKNFKFRSIDEGDVSADLATLNFSRSNRMRLTLNRDSRRQAVLECD